MVCCLIGENEGAYWTKILADQEAKLSKKTKTKKRGREKVRREIEDVSTKTRI